MSIFAGDDVPLQTLPLDEERGTLGMWLAIATEVLLFVSLFFAYFYVGQRHPGWPASPPERRLALILLAILVASSAVLHLGERLLERGRRAAARMCIALTIGAGVVFVRVQVLEYRNRLVALWPTENAYSSLFYTITSLHALHVLVGLAILLFVLCLPRLEPAARPPHRPLHNAALYWHFVDVVWIAIVGLLYLLPHGAR
jgi:cytochrome c oxidase subunit 3